MADPSRSALASVEETKTDPYLVQFEPGDPTHPENWSSLKKWYITMAAGLLVLNATFASSAPSGIARDLMKEFDISTEVAVLTLALFIAGYCFGPLLFGPLSEQYGRRPVFMGCFLLYMLFQIGAALAKNTASLLIFRFLGGFFSSCPLANSGAVIADIWDSRTRGKALALYTVAPFAGPALGPTVAGYLSVAGVSWRWLFWILTIFASLFRRGRQQILTNIQAGFCLFVIVFTMPETYEPVLLIHLARKKRAETGDNRYYAPRDKETRKFSKQLEHVLARPFRILFQEPMLIAATVYMSFVYGCLYLLFEAYPVVFTEGHGFNTGLSGLMFLPLMFGGILAVTLYVLIFNPSYEREMIKYAPHPVPPEFRLQPTIFAAPIYAASFFWFGYTSYPSISFWSPLISGLGTGFSISWIFLGLFNYIIDTYLPVSASALSASTVVRSLCGAGFPLFATQMYTALNPRIASTLLGCIAIAMIPIPLVFKRYGHVLRARSRYAPTPVIAKSDPN
ncbi:MFS general substrate transporter [Mycena floridula]|nr:MFS general substrate transporter [Mycena floridula]